ncbi:MAG: RraA family protein [Solirubrobacteraceae bacterium]
MGLPETASLSAAVVSDALDGLGRWHHCLPPELNALDRGGVVVGRAFPVTVARPSVVPSVPYVGLLAALDEIGDGDVYVISSSGARDVALWGELLSTIAIASRVAGAVCDGYVRDASRIRRLGFPVYARGTAPLDIHGRFEVVGHGAPLVIEGVTIERGDLIVADDDGVVVVPQDVEVEVLAAAIAKSNAEDGFRADVVAGMPPSQAWAKHRVL